MFVWRRKQVPPQSDAVSGATQMALPTGIRSVTSKYMDALDITAKSHQIFHKGISPKVAMNPRILSNHSALNFLRVLLAHLRLLSIPIPLVGLPAIGVKPRDAKRFQQLLELQEDIVLPSSEHIRPDLPRMGINGVPQPAWVRFAAHVTPHVVQL